MFYLKYFKYDIDVSLKKNVTNKVTKNVTNNGIISNQNKF